MILPFRQAGKFVCSSLPPKQEHSLARSASLLLSRMKLNLITGEVKFNELQIVNLTLRIIV